MTVVREGTSAVHGAYNFEKTANNISLARDSTVQHGYILTELNVPRTARRPRADPLLCYSSWRASRGIPFMQPASPQCCQRLLANPIISPFPDKVTYNCPYAQAPFQKGIQRREVKAPCSPHLGTGRT